MKVTWAYFSVAQDMSLTSGLYYLGGVVVFSIQLCNGKENPAALHIPHITRLTRWQHLHHLEFTNTRTGLGTVLTEWTCLKAQTLNAFPENRRTRGK
jgi:hypothetical protein